MAKRNARFVHREIYSHPPPSERDRGFKSYGARASEGRTDGRTDDNDGAHAMVEEEREGEGEEHIVESIVKVPVSLVRRFVALTLAALFGSGIIPVFERGEVVGRRTTWDVNTYALVRWMNYGVESESLLSRPPLSLFARLTSLSLVSSPQGMTLVPLSDLVENEAFRLYMRQRLEQLRGTASANDRARILADDANPALDPDEAARRRHRDFVGVLLEQVRDFLTLLDEEAGSLNFLM